MDYTCDAFGTRVRSLVAALLDCGFGPDDRIETFGWNHHRHFKTDFAAPLSGAQLHIINVMLGHDDIVHIIEDADDDILFVDLDEVFDHLERL